MVIISVQLFELRFDNSGRLDNRKRLYHRTAVYCKLYGPPVAGKVLIMTAQQPGNDVEMEQLEPQPVLSIRATVQIVDLAQAQDDRLRALSSYLRQCGAQLAGPPFVRYHTFTQTETDVELGIPVVAPIAGEGRIAAGELGGGPAISTWHIGAHDTLAEAYARIQAWLKAHGREPDGAAWEVYYWIDPNQYRGPVTWPDSSSWRTQLIQPIK
jgi:effector-binding domain-containing protein